MNGGLSLICVPQTLTADNFLRNCLKHEMTRENYVSKTQVRHRHRHARTQRTP
jgi:hypothetical protein